MTLPTAWSTEPATTWERGVVAGTGIVGAVVWGDPSRHVLALSHESFFVPVHSRRAAPELAPALPAVRAALRGGDARTAADLVDDRLRAVGWDPAELIWTDPLGPIAQLEWHTDEAGSGYRRDIPLGDAGVAISWDRDGYRTGMALSARRGASELTLELWSDAESHGTLLLREVAEAAPGATTVETLDARGAVAATRRRDDRGVELELRAPGHDPDTATWARARVEPLGDVEVTEHPDGWRVKLIPGRRARFRVLITTGAAEPEQTVDGDAADLLARCELRLGPSQNRLEFSVEEWWAAARRGDLVAERAVVETAFAAGRRTIVGSSGVLPPTLQGVWQGTWSPAWSADYTLNGNVQHGTLAAVLWTGTPELMTALFRLVLPRVADYRNNARAVFGAPGLMMPSRMTTHGHANHFIRDYPHEFWAGGGAWFLRLAADYVLVTGDQAPIDDWLWEFAIEVLDFGLAVLTDGEGALIPSYSPENVPAGGDNPLASNATGDIAGLREALLIGTWLADLRGDAERGRVWRAAVELLPAPVVANDGTLAEWSGEWPENLGHRHASQLQGLWYEPDPRLLEGSLRAAAEQTVRRKIAWRAEAPSGPPGRMEMAFGLASLGLAAATLGDAASAYQCAVWLAREHFTPGLMSTHDAGAIFNADASGALPAVIAAMLVGSRAGELRLLPALPPEWPEGEVTGLTARGAVRVARLAWTPDGLTTHLELPEHGRWLRPHGTRVAFPAAVKVVRSSGVEQVDDRTVLIPAESLTAEFEVRWRDAQIR